MSMRSFWGSAPLSGLMAACATSFLFGARPTETIQLVGQFEIARSGERLAFVLIDRRGARHQVQIPFQVLASSNGIDAIEGRWVVADVATGLKFPLVRALQLVPKNARERTHDPILLDRLPEENVLHLAKPGYTGPVTNVYEAMRAHLLDQRAVHLVLKPESITLGEPSKVARLYLGGDARHYLLISPASTMQPGRPGVTIEEVREDNLTQINDGSGCVLSHDVIRVPNPFGGSAWFAGQICRLPSAVITVTRSVAGESRVKIHPMGAVASSVNVINSADSGAGSLRNAITFCNSNTGYLTINFNLPLSDPSYDGHAFNIPVPTQLPALFVDGLGLSGSSQIAFTGDTNSGKPAIFLRGPGSGTFADGLTLNFPNEIVDKIGIGGFSNGISINAASARIRSSFIGVDSDGVTPRPNAIGINDDVAAHCIIGGASGDRNIISGNASAGILIQGQDCTVGSNFIGTDFTGEHAVPNDTGIELQSITTGSTIGSATSTNLISGNSHYGILALNALSLNVKGNWIGVDATGYLALPNQYGVYFTGGDNLAVGGSGVGEGNVISGNTAVGLRIASDDGPNPSIVHATILANVIGLTAKARSVVANDTGISISGAVIAHIGNGSSVGANVVSGNSSYGVFINMLVNGAVAFAGDMIGTDYSGASACPNRIGIYVSQSSRHILIGGTTAGQRNLISGNTGAGIAIGGTDVQVLGNTIGLNGLGTAAIANGMGIDLETGNTLQVFVGSPASGGSNVIAGNTGDGIRLGNAAQTTIQNNYIGILPNGTAFANHGNGIHVQGLSTGNLIGGSGPHEGNVISGNSQVGVFFDGAPFGPGTIFHPHLVASAPNGNTVAGNIIGLNPSQTSAVPNGTGISIRAGAHHNLVGGESTASANAISGNAGVGIVVADAQSAFNSIQANMIGRALAGSTVFGNGSNGVVIGAGATGTAVGNTRANVVEGNHGIGIRLAGAGNLNCNVRNNMITNNVVGQIQIDTGASNAIVSGNAVKASGGQAAILVRDATTQSNSLRGNTYLVGDQLLVDLVGNDGPFGVTPNDTKDLDAGPNNLQNNANINTSSLSGGVATFTGTLGAKPNTTFSVDIYMVDAGNSANHGGTIRFLTTFPLTTNSAGLVTFTRSLAVSGHPIGLCTQVTAPTGESSEFGGNRYF